MKALKWIGISLLGLLVLCVGIGLFLPADWHVEVSTVIDAPPEQIHPYIDNTKTWVLEIGEETAKRLEQDTSTMEYTFNDVESGVGAGWSWTSGADYGRIAWTKSDPATGIEYEGAIMSDEVNDHGSVTYEVVEGGGTKVTWTDDGQGMAVIGGYMKGEIEGMLGNYFGEMLSTLKTKVEAAGAAGPDDAPTDDAPADDG